MRFCEKAASALAALVLTAPPIWSKPNISDLARQCYVVGKQNACRELAKIAVEDKDASIRGAAVATLTDQSLLAKIALEDGSEHVRRAAVYKLTDQSLLAKIALEDRNDDVRLAAMSKLTDQFLLAKIALEDDRSANVRRSAVERITDQTVLAKFAMEGKNNYDFTLRRDAVGRVTDQSLLAKIAAEDREEGVRLAAMSKLTATGIYGAAQDGDLVKVEALLKDHPDLVSRKDPYDPQGRTPLHYAALNGHNIVVNLLLANNAEVNAKTSSGVTPLHMAAASGYKGLAELLLAKGADVNIRNNQGVTPLHAAVIADHEDVVELLLANEADVNAETNEGRTPLYFAGRLLCRAVTATIFGADGAANRTAQSTSGGCGTIELLLRQHGGH